MSDVMEYKGYVGSVSFSDEDAVFHGKLEFIRDLVTFEGGDVKSLRRAFQAAVEDYLEDCRTRKRAPDQPFKGTFNVRTGPRLHRRAVLHARARRTNLNSVITEALEAFLAKTG